jgi:probable HAF family extracellular repeat protein
MRGKRRFIILMSVGIAAGIALVVWRLSAPAPWYRVTVFATITGKAIRPCSLNDRGQVVGFMEGESGQHLFLWDRTGGMQDLGPVSGRECAINNAGQIATTLIDSNGNERAALRDPNGAIQFLGTLGGALSVATALNNRGQVVGWSATGPDANGRTVIHAFLWGRASGMRDLNSMAEVVNDAGQVFGRCQSQPGPDMPHEPCYWNPADATAATGRRLPDRAYADMNNQGYVVGTHYFSDFKPYVVLWRDYTGLKKLFPHDPGDNPFGGAFLVNDANQVICSQVHGSRWGRFSRRLFPVRIRYFLWDPQHGRIPLDRYVRGLGSFEVRDLNNKGCTLGIVHAKDGSSASVLLEPIPERWKE